MLDARVGDRVTKRYRIATRMVSMGRALDPRARAQKLTRALVAAKASGAEHFVISGDLTEVGAPAEFEHFARVLGEAKLPESSVTLVPGNHDMYTSPLAWNKALAGPLAPFASASATRPGKVVDRGTFAILPIDTSCFQTIARAGGEFTANAASALSKPLADQGLKHKAVVLVLHHPPFMHYSNPLMRWVDGLQGCTRVRDLLVRHPRVQVLHGHLHKVVDRIVEALPTLSKVASARARVFGAPATVDDESAPRVRLYDVRDGALEAVGMFAM